MWLPYRESFLMLALSAKVKFYVATRPIDFRSGIDMLASICRQRFQMDPMDGSVFLFVNRRRTMIKVLSYDGQGFWLATKRLSKGRFQHFPHSPTDATLRLVAEQVAVLCRGGDPLDVAALPEWRPLQ
jgi:transposase